MFNNFNKKIRILLETLKTEYENIICEYENEKLFNKSLPIKASNKCTLEQKEQIETYLKDMFTPTFEILSPIIDSGIIELESISNTIDLNISQDIFKLYENLIYESWDKLYIYKYIKYNVILNFILQLYIIFERELIINIKKHDAKFLDYTLFNAIKYLERNMGINFSTEMKSKLDLYRNVINVYKHGYGTSYIEIEKNNPNVINFQLNKNIHDNCFLFKLDKINFYELYDTIIEFIKTLENNC